MIRISRISKSCEVTIVVRVNTFTRIYRIVNCHDVKFICFGLFISIVRVKLQRFNVYTLVSEVNGC